MPLDTPRANRIRLEHMLSAAIDAQAFSMGKSRASLNQDPMYRRALVNCVQEIGEAANHVSRDCRDRLIDVPWVEIIGMRNQLVHGYASIDSDSLRDVVREDLPPLIQALRDFLGDSGSIP